MYNKAVEMIDKLESVFDLLSETYDEMMEVLAKTERMMNEMINTSGPDVAYNTIVTRTFTIETLCEFDIVLL